MDWKLLPLIVLHWLAFSSDSAASTVILVSENSESLFSRPKAIHPISCWKLKHDIQVQEQYA